MKELLNKFYINEKRKRDIRNEIEETIFFLIKCYFYNKYMN